MVPVWRASALVAVYVLKGVKNKNLSDLIYGEHDPYLVLLGPQK